MEEPLKTAQPTWLTTPKEQTAKVQWSLRLHLHDRLGSVRLVIDDEGGVQNYYTYEPFGQTIESGGTLDNPFRFTGQYFDSEIEEYYLRARSPGDISVGDRPLWDMHYTPHIARFTSHDPVASDDSWLLPSARNLSCNSN
jgi:hypothetical protein